MTDLYFWVGGRVDHRSWKEPGEIPRGHFCVDTAETWKYYRFGKYKPEGGWQPIPLSNFPKEFRAALLLLGVS